MNLSEMNNKERIEELTAEKKQKINSELIELENVELKQALESFTKDLMKYKESVRDTVNQNASLMERSLERMTTANEILKKDLGNVVGNLKDDMSTFMLSNLTEVSRKSQEYISELERLKYEATKQNKSFYDRRKILDILVYINLAITPILFLIIAYLVFLK